MTDEALNLAAARIMGYTDVDRFGRPIDKDWHEFAPAVWIEDAMKLVEAMRGNGLWLRVTSPFAPGEPWFAGFTPHGVSGWNGRPDIEASADSLPRALTLAAVRAFEAVHPSPR